MGDDSHEADVVTALILALFWFVAGTLLVVYSRRMVELMRGEWRSPLKDPLPLRWRVRLWSFRVGGLMFVLAGVMTISDAVSR